MHAFSEKRKLQLLVLSMLFADATGCGCFQHFLFARAVASLFVERDKSPLGLGNLYLVAESSAISTSFNREARDLIKQRNWKSNVVSQHAVRVFLPLYIYSLNINFRVINFRGQSYPRKYFYNENFTIYGSSW